jgi:hypothetical protein
MKPFPVSSIDEEAAEPRNRQSRQEPCGVMPARLSYCAVQQQISASPPFEGVAMTIEGKPSLGEMTWMTGRGGRSAKARLGNIRTRLALLLPAAAIVGVLAWTILPRPSDAEGDFALLRSAVLTSEQNLSWFEPVITRIQATVTTPANTNPAAETPSPATVPAATAPAQATPPVQESSLNPAATEAVAPEPTAPVDGLKISSQSWRRGGLGSKALITFTLRNGNDYPVKDIEIACSFSRRDGSHLTDRTRTIHDVVNMKSRKRFARLHVGFVNVNADKAKCFPVAASHI